MQRAPLLLGLALAAALVCGCFSTRGRLALATPDGVRIATRTIQADVETRTCATRLFSLIPLSRPGTATPEATLRRMLMQFPDGKAAADVELRAEHRSYVLLVDRQCWTVRADVVVLE